MLDVFINSIGYYVPEGRITNDEILNRFSDENIGNLTKEELELLLYGNQRKFDFLGIKTRAALSVQARDTVVSMAVNASKNAMEKAGLKPHQIDCIIFSGVTNPFREPSFSIILAHQIGVEEGDFFDINDTCNGFMKSIDVASMYIKTGRYKNILIATSESPYEVLEGFGASFGINSPEDNDRRLTSLYVGSGAGAMILSSQGSTGKIIHYAEKRESKNWDASILALPHTSIPDTRFGKVKEGFWSDGRMTASTIIRDLPDFASEKLKEWNTSVENIDLFFLHQLGNNITFATLDRLGVPREKAPINTFECFGNMACANIPVNFALAVEKGMVRKGDSILLMGSACGISYSIVHIEW